MVGGGGGGGEGGGVRIVGEVGVDGENKASHRGHGDTEFFMFTEGELTLERENTEVAFGERESTEGRLAAEEEPREVVRGGSFAISMT